MHPQRQKRQERETTRRLPAAEPIRTCIGCRRRRRQSELVRLARPPGGHLTEGRTVAGRGAWLCAGSKECFDQAVQRQGFTRALLVEVPREEIEALRARLFG